MIVNQEHRDAVSKAMRNAERSSTVAYRRALELSAMIEERRARIFAARAMLYEGSAAAKLNHPALVTPIHEAKRLHTIARVASQEAALHANMLISLGDIFYHDLTLQLQKYREYGEKVRPYFEAAQSAEAAIAVGEPYDRDPVGDEAPLKEKRARNNFDHAVTLIENATHNYNLAAIGLPELEREHATEQLRSHVCELQLCALGATLNLAENSPTVTQAAAAFATYSALEAAAPTMKTDEISALAQAAADLAVKIYALVFDGEDD